MNIRFSTLVISLLLLQWISSGNALAETLEVEAPKVDPSAKVDPSLLTIDRIFNSKEFQLESGPGFKWSKKGAVCLTLESGTKGQKIVAHDLNTGKIEIIVPENLFIPDGQTKPINVEDYEFSEDNSKLLLYTNSKKVWRVNSRGDYWTLDLATKQLKKLGGDIPTSTMMFATFSPDGKSVAFVHKNNIRVQKLDDFSIVNLTSNGSPKLINGTFDWVYEEELGLRNGFRWSPDSQTIAYWQIDSSGVKDFLITSSAEGPYAKLISFGYPKTGEKNPAARIGVVSAQGGDSSFLEIPGDTRDHYLAKMDWVDKEIVIQQFNRLQNKNIVMVADPKTKNCKPILIESDKAWVEHNNEMPWINKNQSFIWLSERDGWSHIYLVSRTGDKVTQLTKGNFDVIHIEAVDEKAGWIYFLASPDNATQRYLYRVSLNGGDPELISTKTLKGTHSYIISSDASYAVHRFSNFNTPPIADLITLPDHKVLKTYTDNSAFRKKLETIKKPTTEFVKVKINDETKAGEQLIELDAWSIKPPDFDPSKKYPLLFYVYGEPAGQTVLDRWDGKRFLWHSLLAQKGFVVMSIDNRGTPAPKGRDWRKIIYRQIGILASSDQAKSVKELLKTYPYLDASRVAIWGWSGGGSMTLNAMFRYPEIYKTGISIAPVPNQRHYDTIYQERYMGLPSDNAEGYKKGSPITFANQLKGKLLLVHGTGDDNCHYLGMENLIDELISHNKQFTMLGYPNRSHSINEGKNTTRHLYDLLTKFLLDNN